MTTREQIIAAASNVGAYRYVNRAAKDEPTHTFTIEQLERFYTIAFEAGRVAEREECAKVCREEGKTLLNAWNMEIDIAKELSETCNDCAEAIRARSTK